MSIRFIFSNGISLRYLLNDSIVAKTWLGMMKKVCPTAMSRIGRHFLEMVNANDFVCFQQHFRPQWNFNPTCAINFSEFRPQHLLEEKMLAFYNARGGRDFFGFDYTDQRMEKGFFNLGQMENLSQYSLNDREHIRSCLSTARVIRWEFE